MAGTTTTITVIAFTIVSVLKTKVCGGAQLNCQYQWNNHDWCMKNREYEYKRTKDLTEYDRNGMKNDIRTCYRRESCRDPFASSSEDYVRSYCYKQSRDSLRLTIQRCMNTSYPDYSLPKENDVSNELGQDMLNIQISSCAPKNNLTFTQCLARARGSRGNNTYFRNADYCQVRSQCYQRVSFQKQCYDRSASVRDQLCLCTKKLNVTVFVQQYKQCMAQYRYPVKNNSLDYNVIAFEHFSGTRYCVNYTDPCGGFYGQNKLPSLTTTTKAPVKVVAGATPPPVAAKPKLTKSNDVTQNGGLDFGSLLTSGGVFPDPQDVLANAGFGNMTGPGGFDAANLMSQNFDLMSLFGQFNPFGNIDLATLFGGMDLSNIFGGLFGGAANPFATSTTTQSSTTTVTSTVSTPSSTVTVGSDQISQSTSVHNFA